MIATNWLKHVLRIMRQRSDSITAKISALPTLRPLRQTATCHPGARLWRRDLNVECAQTMPRLGFLLCPAWMVEQ